MRLKFVADGLRRMVDYTNIARQLKQVYNVRIRRWRNNMTGAAWRVDYSDGRTVNWIESPRPRSPISLAIFLHEIGHHVIGFDRYKLSCEEELHAWRWAIETMRQLGIEPDDRVLRRYRLSMQYAVEKALRRGLTVVPDSLQAFHRNAA